MWNIAHPAPRNALKNTPKTPEAANIPMRRNITSPAYMFPNSRNECDNGLDTYSIMLNKKLVWVEDLNQSSKYNRPVIWEKEPNIINLNIKEIVM